MANYDIGTLNSKRVSKNRFSVTPFDSNDIFEFDVFGARNINLNLHNISSNDDADLYLYRDSNNNGRWDSSDTRIGSSVESGNAPDTLSVGVGTGTYFAEVRRYAAGSRGSVTYDLDLSTTYDVGTIGRTPTSRNNYSLNATSSKGVFEFDISGSKTIHLNLHDISFGDDADLSLYRDSNDNGIFDSADVRVASSRRGGNRDDILNYRGEEGKYFAEVSRYRTSQGSLTYDLDLSATSGRNGASNLLAGETDLGTLSSRSVTRTGQVSDADTTDTYAFSLNGRAGYQISLMGTGGDADIRLIRDANRNGIVDSHDVLESSMGRGASEQISNVNTPGDYFLQVYQYGAGTTINYSLNFEVSGSPSIGFR